ncbi:uncharacterized protein BCR38DRAFT_19989 [Pseudomassariella vexata]|uniref:Uncharacterized protein n=1 Tax=Pseudomassariella vexata TaxID=1141098 RepID=A0A1Y2EKE8_9PEZI|nr:uncharacterized protein BCR38DRAFT_19989 [Pseudomassariella vexata]ORY71776.1 hypothetical protein BCR38DRAFT_19989 [Pseudomassariella vexata]
MQKQSHKHKSSRRDRPPRSANDTTETAWSLSQWHPEHNQFYRSRYKGSGEVEYEWLGSELPPTTESAPRTNINVDSLAQGMTNLDVNQNVGYGQDPSGGYADPHTAAEVSADLGLSTSPRYTHSIPQDHHTKPHARKGNGKEFAYEGTTVPSRKGKEVANEEPIAASRKGKGRSSHYDDQAGLQPAFSAAGHTSQCKPKLSFNTCFCDWT